MSFLLKHFGKDMKHLSLIRKVKTKNDIGEMVDTESLPVCFDGIIMSLKTYGSSYQIDKNIPINESTHSLRCELGISIKRDDIIIDCNRHFIVKDLDLQDDLGGNVDHQLLFLKHYE